MENHPILISYPFNEQTLLPACKCHNRVLYQRWRFINKLGSVVAIVAVVTSVTILSLNAELLARLLRQNPSYWFKESAKLSACIYLVLFGICWLGLVYIGIPGIYYVAELNLKKIIRQSSFYNKMIDWHIDEHQLICKSTDFEYRYNWAMINKAIYCAQGFLLYEGHSFRWLPCNSFKNQEEITRLMEIIKRKDCQLVIMDGKGNRA